LAALTSFYQLAGQAVEDILTNLVAWSIWTDDKSKSLADIFERLSLRLSVPSAPVGEDYISEIKTKYRDTKKRVDIYPREYLRELLKCTDAELPNAIGIEWKRFPSVKLVPKEIQPLWDKLPSLVREVMAPLTTGRGDLLAACYNKAKHGPQLVVSRPNEALSSRGLSVDDMSSVQSNAMTVRLLMDGARTQETQEEVQSGTRIAPFLVDDLHNIKNVYFQQIVHQASSLYSLGTFIFNSTYREHKRDHSAPSDFVYKITKAQAVHTNALK
jgi:hypothetical protein